MLEMRPLLGAGRRGSALAASSGSCTSIDSLDSHDGEKQVLNACLRGDYTGLSFILANHGNPNECDSKGKTGLHCAAARGREDILEKLLENGADLKITDSMGNTALHYCGHPETINCLVYYGADLNARNKNGDEPIALMKRRGVENGSLERMEELLGNIDDQSVDEIQQPLLRKTFQRSRNGSQFGIFAVQKVWFEFCQDIGAERLVIVLLLVLCLSVYVAYLATELAKNIDTRIPIEDEVQKMEL